MTTRPLPFDADTLPHQGGTPVSRHTSWKAGQHAAARRREGTLVARYLDLLRARPSADFEAARVLGVDRSSINSVRNMPRVKPWIYAEGTVTRPETGEANALWHVCTGAPL